ncbi:50S ribosomal protein L18 [Fuerstiella marisgermanici]|uniref:Large ribosomal subunit protein uL18 n=1 Tax=Fuerstiella marisgermanici TaxID=1891926 RepID=A0A1P8WQ73_9PLAN|nr:50S ribosomal protein L18 [Fuerstiella marisgermanici]APZ96216.1 putative 50S ribosomal protein L18 [Fuerstiella marisgermanici]
MKTQKRLAQRSKRRGFRVRNRVRRDAHGRPRLSVFKSNRHIYAQIIDDAQGRTLVAASTLESAVAGAGKVAGTCEMAETVGKLIGERAKEKGIESVVFDRGPFRYHGRVAALAEAARAQGLTF